MMGGTRDNPPPCSCCGWGVTAKDWEGRDPVVFVMRNESEARNAVRDSTKAVRKINGEWIDADDDPPEFLHKP